MLADVTAAPEHRRSKAHRIDLLLLVVLVAAAFGVAAWLDLFERFSRWSSAHDQANVDELAMASMVATVGLVLYAWRRLRETQAESAARRAAERALAESGERYRSLFDYHPLPVFSIDLGGRFVAANRASEELAGHSVEELRTMDFFDLVVAEDAELTGAAFLRVLDREPQVVDLRVRHRDGRIVELMVTAVPIVVADEVVGVHGIAEDITERNRLQRELEEARLVAEEANQAKSIFLANMSHEIRTPLTSVLAASELLADSGLSGPQERLTGIMHRSGARLLRLVDEILDLSRVESGHATLDRAEFDPRMLVEDVVGPVRGAAADKGLAFAATVDPSLPGRLHGDAVRVAQVVANLLDNAVKFTDTGFVRLSVTSEPLDDTRVALHLVVEDSGIGMSPDESAGVFESFRQADASITRRYGGTGLGLAIARQLVDLMGGTISVASVAGEGTAFSVALPLGVVAREPNGTAERSTR